MAIIYYDYANGNDSTGNGTYSNPYKSLNKATTGLTGGDEVRAAVTAQTTLSGTMTFTNGSDQVTTTVDLTSVLQANDIIKHGAAHEGWWLILSITNSAITLNKKYYGTDGAGKTCYKIRPVVIAATDTNAVSGTSTSSRLKISGGWTLGTQTKTGITAITATITSVYPFQCETAKYLEVSDFYFSQVFSSSYPCFYIGPYSHIHDIFWGGTEGEVAFMSLFENCIGAGFIGESLDLWNCADPISGDYSLRGRGHTQIKDVWIYSSKYGVYVSGIYTLFDNLNMIGTEKVFMDFEYSTNCYIKNSTFDTQWGTPQNSETGAFIAEDSQCFTHFYNCTFKDIPGGLFSDYWVDMPVSLFKVYECEIINSPYLPVAIDYEYVVHSDMVTLFHTKTGDSFRTYKDGGKISWTETGSRSGRCLVFEPFVIISAIRDKIGAYKITEEGTDIEASVYIKKDENFVGKVRGFCTINGGFVNAPEDVVPTTDYVKYSWTIDSALLIMNNYIDFYIEVYGSAGKIFVDDVSIDLVA